MNKKVRLFLATVCLVALLLTSGCVSFSSVSEGLGAMQTNTTVEEAMADISQIEAAIKEAKNMVKLGDASLYGDSVHTDTVSFGDVVKAKELKTQAKTKRIDGVEYKLYWDITADYPFWSSDGADDIRNNENRVHDITHKSSVQIKTKTNITELK